MQREEAYKIAQQCAQFLKERFKVDNVYIFGSVAGDGIWHKRSDIDIAVEGLPSDKYFRALADISKIAPHELSLDLVTLENAPIKLKERVLTINNGNKKMFESKIERLKWQIEAEFDELERVTNKMDLFLQKNYRQQPNDMEISGVGAYLQNFYSGIERIFERITITFGMELPEGENWHTDLLNQMEMEYPDIRQAVITHDLAEILLEYLRFRHLFRHIYSVDLDWNRILPLAEDASKILKTFKEQIACFLNKIQELKANEA